MTIEFDCSGCKTALRLPDDMAGLRAQCVKCGEVLTIPSPTAHYWPPGSQQAAARSAAASTSSIVARPAAASHAKPIAEPAPASACDTVVDLSETIVFSKPAPSGASAVQGGSSIQNGDGIHNGNGVQSGNRSPAGNGSAGVASPSPAASGVHPRPGASRPIVLAPSPNEKKAAAAPRPQPIQIQDILQRTWGIYKTNFKSLAMAGVVVPLIVAAASAATSFLFRMAPAIVQFCLPQIVLIWLMLGAMAFTIKTARGHRPSLAVLFSGMPLAGSAVAIWIMCFVPPLLAASLAAVAGLPPGFVGGAILFSWPVIGLMIWVPALLVLVDRVASPTEALSCVLRYTKRNIAPLLCLFVLSLLVLVAGALPLGLGLPFAVPFVLLLSTVAYLKDRSRRD
jgi:hypothetical protein